MEQTTEPQAKAPTIYIAADHGGYFLKEKIKKYLEPMKIPVVDVGARELVEDDDYPDYVIPLARRLKGDEKGIGIVICRNGVGVSIVANRFKGVRAGLCFNVKHVISARTDDSINVLALPADYIDEELAKDMVFEWLSTDFSRENRHVRRLAKIHELEEGIS